MKTSDKKIVATIEALRKCTKPDFALLAQLEDSLLGGSLEAYRQVLKMLGSTVPTASKSGQSGTNDWLTDQIFLMYARAVDVQVYFSPGPECVDTILQLLDQAKKAIDICVFTISDDRISRKIVERHQAKIKIRIISDNDKTMDTGSDIIELARKGIPVRVDRTENHMHHKFAIFDNKKVLTGSYNWTRSAERYNEENILVSSHPGAITAYESEYDRLWKMFDPL